ncbi:hypothetical protein DFR49_0870 [Hephaestia caeni]|uniref:Uncharacterized protein n=1 Tax=Hephaestia caeni TaxID=645617 RepID=A0A397PKX3_9SPHN|nr:hypothetical protein [Hephaestia caeni]RIA46331.1 hypothetical protein DFR49_0870 [Hephaestia caeni]
MSERPSTILCGDGRPGAGRELLVRAQALGLDLCGWGSDVQGARLLLAGVDAEREASILLAGECA